jgi:hypothetical protein
MFYIIFLQSDNNLNNITFKTLFRQSNEPFLLFSFNHYVLLFANAASIVFVAFEVGADFGSSIERVSFFWAFQAAA